MNDNNLIAPGEKVASEAEFRVKILSTARRLGCEIEVKQIFEKYDKLLKFCPNKEERAEISRLGICELYRYLDCYSGLTINHEEVIPPEDINKTEDDIIIR